MNIYKVTLVLGVIFTVFTAASFADETCEGNVNILEQQASQGNAQAQLNLGINYLLGKNVPKNLQKAKAFF